MAPELQPSPLAPNLLLGEGVVLGAGVELGGNVVIHAGTEVGDWAVIQDGAVVGKSPRLGTRSTASREPPPPARIGDGAAVLTAAVVFAGAVLGRGAIAGDQSQLRERAVLGNDSVLGRGSAVENDAVIGDRVRIQSNCYIAAYTEIDDDVFVGPGVTTTNDNTIGRHRRGAPTQGPCLRRACRVGGGAVLCPAVTIGEEAFVAAGAVVTADVEPRAVVIGVPARVVRSVGDDDLIERYT